MTNKTNDGDDLIEKDVQSHDHLQLMESRAKDAQQFGELLGSMRTHTAYHKLSGVGRLQKIAQIKDSKYYQSYLGEMVEINGVPADLGKWENFCLYYFGETQQNINAKLKNLSVFGEEMMEAFVGAGIGVSKLTALRKLPEGEISNVVETIKKTEDKKEIAEFVATVIAQQNKQKEALQAKIDEEKAEREASDKVIAKKNDKIDELEKALAKEENATPYDRAQLYAQEIAKVETEMMAVFARVDNLFQSIGNEAEMPVILRANQGHFLLEMKAQSNRLIDLYQLGDVSVDDDQLDWVAEAKKVATDKQSELAV